MLSLVSGRLLNNCLKSLASISVCDSHFDVVKHELQKIKYPKPIKYPRMRNTKHKDMKYRAHRGRKFIKVSIPDLMSTHENLTPQELRVKAKELGLPPERYWNEKPVFITCSNELFDPYVPPEGDGKISIASYEGSKQALSYFGKKGRSMMSVRKIKSFDENFDINIFPSEAQKILVESHEALMKNDEDKLHILATEKAIPEMMFNTKLKTLKWKLLESIEAPRVVHVRCAEILEKNNLFAQITVRFHTKQTLAMYDRFGRLEHGSETVSKDVLEYVVFEKHIVNEYGIWRIHGKVIPDWLPPKSPREKTFIKPVIELPSDKPKYTQQLPEPKESGESDPKPLVAS